jgi:hypothetical protein
MGKDRFHENGKTDDETVENWLLGLRKTDDGPNFYDIRMPGSSYHNSLNISTQAVINYGQSVVAGRVRGGDALGGLVAVNWAAVVNECSGTHFSPAGFL